MTNEQVERSLEQTGQQIRLLRVDDLLLDPENPRLASTAIKSKPSQFDLLKTLWTEMSVDELVLSISANGFFPEEPLFVVPDESGSGKFIVIEGNRRLTAVQILRDDQLRKKLKITSMPTIDESSKKKLEMLPVSIYQDRKQLWAYLSFRHINAPMEWDAYSKARYVALVHDDYGVDLEEIARRIGDRHLTVQRMYRGYKVLRQAEEEDIYDVAERYRSKFYFSHWYTALAYSQFQEFLGLQPEDFDKSKPVSDSRQGELEELLVWIYGKKTPDGEVEPKVRKQNPDLNMLREVIANPSALDALRSGYSLRQSHEISIGDPRRFRESLVRAKEELQQAKATVTTGYQGGDNLFRVIQDTQKIARTVCDEMKQIRETVD